MINKEIYEFYPVKRGDKKRISKFLKEIKEVLLTRADGVSIEITRNNRFPEHNGKPLIESVQIKTWDIAS